MNFARAKLSGLAVVNWLNNAWRKSATALSLRASARPTHPPLSRTNRSKSAGSVTPCSISTSFKSADDSGLNRTTWHRDRIVGNCVSVDVASRMSTDPGGGSSSDFSRQLADSSFSRSASSIRHTRPRPRAGRRARFATTCWATSTTNSCLSSGRVNTAKSGCVSAITWAHAGQ